MFMESFAKYLVGIPHSLISTFGSPKLKFNLRWTNFVYSLITESGGILIISAIGFIWIKQSRDPLAGVQKLDFLNMVSDI
jgi:hypothetical protein